MTAKLAAHVRHLTQRRDRMTAEISRQALPLLIHYSTGKQWATFPYKTGAWFLKAPEALHTEMVDTFFGIFRETLVYGLSEGWLLEAYEEQGGCWVPLLVYYGSTPETPPTPECLGLEVAC